MKDCLLEFKTTGECRMDIDKTKKKWSLLCRIYQYENEFTLVEFTPKGKRKFKCRISENDALTLISDLRLEKVMDKVFTKACSYLNIQ